MRKTKGNIEALVIAKALDDQNLEAFIEAGVKPIHFTDKHRPHYEWLLDYRDKHGAVPPRSAFDRAFAAITLPDASKEILSGLVEELVDTYRYREITTALSEAATKLDAGDGDPDPVIQILNDALSNTAVQGARLRDTDIAATWEERWEAYEYRRQHPDELLGIPTGFPTLDLAIGGLRPQQLIVLVGEPKRGKSLLSLLIAMAAHRDYYQPFYVSFEMSHMEISIRHDSILTKIPIARFLDGGLTATDMKAIKKVLKRHNADRNAFYISEDTSRMTTVPAIQAKAMRYDPDFIIVDGVYMMDDHHGEQKGSPQALTNISRGLKRMAQDLDKPVIATTQVLPSKVENSRTRKITGAAIGYTSAFLQDADLILGVEKDPDHPGDRSILRIVEGRSVGGDQEFSINWDWHNMDFSVVREENSIYEEDHDGHSVFAD